MLILGLGSNLNDRLSYLSQALEYLSKIVNIEDLSPIYESNALLPDGAPPSWDQPFLNMVITATSSLSPQELLSEIKNIEQKIGRQNSDKRWAPREIDIDILAYDSLTVEDENLSIPHPDMLKRFFVIGPISDIKPDWTCPGQSKTALEISKEFKDDLNTKKTELRL